MQGDRDLQVLLVGLQDARALEAAQPAAKLLVVPGMNHLLVDAPADPPGNLATYARSDLPLSPALLKGLTDFLKASFSR